MNMATLGVSGRSAIFPKLLLCLAVGVAGLIAGRLSLERPSEKALAAPRRDLTDAEKKTILAALTATSMDPTPAGVDWPALILLSRDGTSDYCGTFGDGKDKIAFYAQLAFPNADPRESLSRVAFIAVAMPEDLRPRHVVGTVCLRYGYGPITPAAP